MIRLRYVLLSVFITVMGNAWGATISEDQAREIATAFMATGMMLPGMLSGVMQEWMGYRGFFLWIMACCAVTFIVSAFLKIDKNFGKKTGNNSEPP